MGKRNIIGRDEEIKILEEVKKSTEAEFVAVYGRRRVGKTFLIREFFSNVGIYFEATGIKDASLAEQLLNFTTVFSNVFFDGIPIEIPKTWNEAFSLLTKKMSEIPTKKKLIIFLDELPWMASRKSGLMQALDFYWNRYWSSQKNIILIACGSAASWMLSNLINAKGGLFHRLTKRIQLEPFDLAETEKFLKSRSIKLTRKAILDLYMAIGGIPFYLKEVKVGQSVSQAIDNLCFNKRGLLYSEFELLFKSLFDHAEINLNIVREIFNSNNSISREDLMKAVGLSSGGNINRRLEELEASNFIQCFIPYGKKRRDRFYRITDEYTLFYFKWIKPLAETGARPSKTAYWSKISSGGKVNAWSGLAFESICFKHIELISQALGLQSIAYRVGSWRYVASKNSTDQGAQIDLLFDREDKAITLCEIKYCDYKFLIDKKYAQELDRKIEVFSNRYPSKHHPTSKQIFLAMISTFGIKKNLYSESLVQNEVTLEDLFA